MATIKENLQKLQAIAKELGADIRVSVDFGPTLPSVETLADDGPKSDGQSARDKLFMLAKGDDLSDSQKDWLKKKLDRPITDLAALELLQKVEKALNGK